MVLSFLPYIRSNGYQKFYVNYCELCGLKSNHEEHKAGSRSTKVYLKILLGLCYLRILCGSI